MTGLSQALTARCVPGGGLAVDRVDRSVPTPAGHDLSVRVRAISVNPVDVKRVRASERGIIPGFDAVGEVVATGPAACAHHVGDRVFYAGTLQRDGAAQDTHLVDERLCARAPTGWEDTDAAALPLTMITAWEALIDKLDCAPSHEETILVVGGAGGVGSAVIQLARALLPAVDIIATASRSDSAAWARRQGAHHVVDHTEPLAPQVRALSPGGVTKIVSTASGGRIEEFADVLSPFGHVVGVDRGPIDVTPLKPLSATWHWIYMFTKAVPDWSGPGTPHAMILERVAELAANGKLRSPVHSVVPELTVDSLRDALLTIEGGHGVGKTVIRLE